MSLAIQKTDANIAPPANAPLDLDSGAQRATVNGGIGITVTTAGDPVAGASVGAAIAADYHEAV